MSDLDKLFKKKLEHRSFEFKDAYWEAAEQLIEKEEGRRRRKFGWWWIGLLLAVGLSAGVIYFTQSQVEAVEQTPISASMNATKLANTTENKNPSSTNLITSNSENEQINTTEKTDAALATNAEEITEQNGSNNEVNTSEQTPVEVAGSGYASETERRAVSEASISEYKIKPQAIDNTSLSNSPVANEETLVIKSEQEVKVSVQSYEKESAVITDSSTPISESKESVNFAALELLETRDLLAIEKKEREEEALALVTTTILKPKRLSLSLDIATMFTVASNFKGHSGDAFGLAINYRLKDRWSIQGGLRYAIRRPQNFSDLQTGADSDSEAENLDQLLVGAFVSTTNYYNFGLIQVNEITEVKNFHFIEIPVAMQWQANRHSLGLGLQLNYLVGVRGTQSLETSQSSVSSNNLNPGVETVVPGSTSKSWLDRDLYKKWSPEIFFNYGFSLFPRWDIYAGVNYRFSEGQISSNNAQMFDGVGFFNRETEAFVGNSLYFRLGMRYTLGK